MVKTTVTDLDVSPGDRQDGTGAPGGGADGAQWAARVDWIHRDHRVAGQEGGEVGLPVEEENTENQRWIVFPRSVYIVWPILDNDRNTWKKMIWTSDVNPSGLQGATILVARGPKYWWINDLISSTVASEI